MPLHDRETLILQTNNPKYHHSSKAQLHCCSKTKTSCNFYLCCIKACITTSFQLWGLDSFLEDLKT